LRVLQAISRYWHTLRWLRPVQIFGRIWFRLYRPKPDLRPAPHLRAWQRGGWVSCARTVSITGPETFRFLSVERRLATAGDWNHTDWPKLWLYNAHYFDDLTANDAMARTAWHRDLLSRWIAENLPGHGNGWEPYPTSLRIVNWLKWLMAGHAPVPGMLASLAIQVRWLSRRLEHHLLGNHLWANAKALVFAGACFEGVEAEAWRCLGLKLIARELHEQILADGGHFERSPMYHAILTEDLLDLLQLADRTGTGAIVPRDEWEHAALRMLDWAGVMAHPDSGVSFFNDSALDVAPTLPALRDYAATIGLAMPAVPEPGIRLLAESGYARMEIGPAVVLGDVAPVGPDYLPGHAHADSLSFELSVHGRRVLVNGGTSTYQADAERLRQRGTAAHNTVVVDGQNSSEVWSAFRVARRARVHDVTCKQIDDAMELSAWHDGYRRLPGRVDHHRTWRLRAGGLEIVDTLTGRFDQAVAHYLFAPGTRLQWQVEGGEAVLEPATWHPRFGQSVDTTRLTVRFIGARCSMSFSWS
jgi:uncharacterized heparinase superfamily protein